jgi:hypothetical protein
MYLELEVETKGDVYWKIIGNEKILIRATSGILRQAV